MGTAANTTALTVRVPAELAEALRTHAFITGASVNEIIRKATVDYLRGEGRKAAGEAALERVLQEHAVALDKLANL